MAGSTIVPMHPAAEVPADYLVEPNPDQPEIAIMSRVLPDGRVARVGLYPLDLAQVRCAVRALERAT